MDNLEVFLKLLVLCGGGFLTIVFGAITWWLIKISPQEYKRLHQSSPSFWEVLLGIGKKVKNPMDKNFRQNIFPVINLKTNQWEIRANLKENYF